MFAGKTVLAIVPARGGSKGVPLKNLKPLLGVPLIARVGHLVGGLDFVDRAVVSTDHAEIARVAEQSGLAAPFMRPPELAGDLIGDLDVLGHALTTMEELDGLRYDVVLMLQPTSPMRTPAHVRACLSTLVEGAFDSVWTVSETDSKAHPLKQLVVDGAGQLSYYDPGGSRIIARQQLGTVYHRNGACYAITRECLLVQRSITGRRWGAVVTEDMVSIDTSFDFRLVEFLLTEGAGDGGRVPRRTESAARSLGKGKR